MKFCENSRCNNIMNLQVENIRIFSNCLSRQSPEILKKHLPFWTAFHCEKSWKRILGIALCERLWALYIYLLKKKVSSYTVRLQSATNARLDCVSHDVTIVIFFFSSLIQCWCINDYSDKSHAVWCFEQVTVVITECKL